MCYRLTYLNETQLEIQIQLCDFSFQASIRTHITDVNVGIKHIYVALTLTLHHIEICSNICIHEYWLILMFRIPFTSQCLYHLDIKYYIICILRSKTFPVSNQIFSFFGNFLTAWPNTKHPSKFGDLQYSAVSIHSVFKNMGKSTCLFFLFGFIL